ncbi:MAG: MarR family transcriptional regulator, partial [Acidimicrobiales bacterium]|nr:MarR family transcriptional regulator [Acidimicrobiales bacterium]
MKWQLCCALAAKVAFAVKVRPEVLALDADTHDLAEAARDIADEMERSGLEPVVVASGRPDNVHVLVAIDDAEIRERWCQRAKNAGIDVRRTIRPPLSPHRLGLTTELLHPTSPLEARRRLQRPRCGASDPQARQDLSKGIRRLLRYGDTSQEFPSRSEGIQAFTTACVNAGRPFAYFKAALLNPKNALGQKVRDLPDPDRYLRQSWHSAEKWVAEHPLEDTRSEARYKAAAIRRAAADNPRRPVSDQAVLMALCIRAEAAGTVDALDMSVRDIAVEAAVDKSTVGRSLKRLQGQGWLEQVRPGRVLEA